MALPDEGPHVHLDPFENTPHTILREYHIKPPSNQQTQMGIVPSIDATTELRAALASGRKPRACDSRSGGKHRTM
jgi:hypothetical protein